jgi:hypothetical protein
MIIRFVGVRLSVLFWCVWQDSGFSHIRNVFIFYLLRKMLNAFCSLNAILKVNTAINCTTLQHIKVHTRQLWRVVHHDTSRSWRQTCLFTYAHALLTSKLDEGVKSDSRSCRFNCGKDGEVRSTEAAWSASEPDYLRLKRNSTGHAKNGTQNPGM